MLHLAQVKKNPTSGEIELQLLAQQQSDKIWQISNSQSLRLAPKLDLSEGLLVLVELGSDREILKIKEATDWILDLVEQYLTEEVITSEFVETERARIEQWRQEIVMQSLDLTRRHLEIETHRDQLQELETNLRQEQELLENRWQELKKLEEELASKEINILSAEVRDKERKNREHQEE